MKRIFRFLIILGGVIIAFSVASYVLFGQDPAARLKYELDHDLQVGGAQIRMTSEIRDCVITLRLAQFDGAGTATGGEILAIPLDGIDTQTAQVGAGFIGFQMKPGAPARCTNFDAQDCTNSERSEIQLNLPAVQSDVAAQRVIGWISELQSECLP